MGFDEGCKTIVAMKSLDGEVVPLKRPVAITPEVEVSVECHNDCSFTSSLGRRKMAAMHFTTMLCESSTVKTLDSAKFVSAITTFLCLLSHEV